MAREGSPTAIPQAFREEVATAMSDVVSPGSASEALGMLQSAMGYLAAADATAMAAETQAQCLQALERATAMGTAARAAILGAFTSGQGYSRMRITAPGRGWSTGPGSPRAPRPATPLGPPGRGASSGRGGAGRRGDVGVVARAICGWTDKLPEECREDADAILVGAARAGMDLRDLAALAAEIYARSLPDTPDQR